LCFEGGSCFICVLKGAHVLFVFWRGLMFYLCFEGGSCFICYLYIFTWFWCPTRFPYHIMFGSLNSNTKGVTSGAGTTYPSGAPEFILYF